MLEVRIEDDAGGGVGVLSRRREGKEVRGREGGWEGRRKGGTEILTTTAFREEKERWLFKTESKEMYRDCRCLFP